MRRIDADAFNDPEILAKLRTAEFDDEIQDIVESIPTVKGQKSPDNSSGILQADTTTTQCHTT